MTILGIAQIVIFFALVLAITKPIGVFMFRVFEGERTFLHPILRPFERLIYWLGGVREDVEQSWVRYSASVISFSTFCFLFHLRVTAFAGCASVQSAALFNGRSAAECHAHDSGPGVQHGRELHDQHELAIVRAGNHGELLRADGRTCGPELRFRRRRYRGCCRVDTRICPAQREDDRKLLGRCDAVHALHSASDFDRGRPVLRVAGIDSKFQTL